jgi:hypothetical protein
MWRCEVHTIHLRRRERGEQRREREWQPRKRRDSNGEPQRIRLDTRIARKKCQNVTKLKQEAETLELIQRLQEDIEERNRTASRRQSEESGEDR